MIPNHKIKGDNYIIHQQKVGNSTHIELTPIKTIQLSLTIVKDKWMVLIGVNSARVELRTFYCWVDKNLPKVYWIIVAHSSTIKKLEKKVFKYTDQL
jgi:hypothetical protein